MSSHDDLYHPQWLAFEKTLGEKPQPNADDEAFPTANVEAFNQIGKDLALQWPLLNNQLARIDTGNISVRIYKPREQSDKLPLMLYFHGGGFISGDIDTEDPHCRILAARTPCIVVSVDYPLAPKVDMEQIIRSGLRAIEWARSHQPPLTTSPRLLLAGGSAGGTLALQLAYHFIRQGQLSKVSGLILIQPTCSPAALTPYTGPFAEEHTSAQTKAVGAPNLTGQEQRYMIRFPQMDPTSPRHFPLLAPTLAGFPRAYIVTAEHDPTRDDGKILARRLAEESDGGVMEVCYKGMPHWFHWFPQIPMAHEMMRRTVAGVRWVLATDSHGSNGQKVDIGGVVGKW